jgi:uncharacterized tellurite resistance protein B-like protein
MTTIQLKAEIQKSLDKMPEEALNEVLSYLKLVEDQSPNQLKFNNNLKKILDEDRELFERLAQ